MNRENALAAIKQMKEASSPLDYVTSLGAVKSSVGTELPVKLDEAHAEIEQTRIALAERDQREAKLVIAVAIDKDAVKIRELIEAGKLTAPVARHLVALSERKRADQLVRLAEGDMAGASDADAELQQILAMMDQLPAAVSTEAAPTGAPVAEEAPVAPAAPTGSIDDQIDALAQELMAKDPTLSYEQAALQAAAQLQTAAPQQGGVA